jgi:hypothetical protein
MINTVPSAQQPDRSLEFILGNKRKKNSVEETFNATVGWFYRFKNRVELHHVKITGEATSAVPQNLAF